MWYQQDEFDANVWGLDGSASLSEAWKTTVGNCKDALVGVEELDIFLLGPSDVEDMITALAENVCDTGSRQAKVRLCLRLGVMRNVSEL